LGGLGDVGVQFLPNSVVMAMYEMVQFFNEIGQELLKVKNVEFKPDHSTVNLSRIQRRFQGLNLEFDLRTVPEIPLSQLDEKLFEGVKEIGKHYPDLNLSMSRLRMIPAYQLSTESPFYQNCIGILYNEGEGLCYRNEINESYLFQQAGYDSVSVGPGGTKPGSSHAPNDFIELSEIQKAVEYYVKVIERTCL
jgi:succinyl-diaminopimelate desuccinylase